jgi:FAD/FMN-containing dehydrogenase
MTAIVSFLVAPPDFDLGDEVRMLLGFAWAGSDHDEGAQIVAPLRNSVPADIELIEPTRWVDWQSSVDSALPKGVRAYWKNAFFKDLSDGLIDAIIERAAVQTWLGTGTDLHHMAGAFGQVAEDATPFPNRSANYWLNIYGFWADAADDEHHTAWVRGLYDEVSPYAMGGAYVNAVVLEGGGTGAESRAPADRDAGAQVMAIYGPSKFERLVALKRRYDPENIFRLNHNIPPD